MPFWGPSYSGTIKLLTTNVFAGDEIEGEVIYTANRVYKLKDARLMLRCKVIYYHQGRKKHVLDDPQPISIPLRLSDGKILVSKKCQLEVNKDTVFKFKERLPFGLPPSTEEEEGNRRVLAVSYKLKLSSKHPFFRIRNQDSSKTLTVSAQLGLDTPPFSETDGSAQEFKDSHFGQGLDMKAKVCLPRFTWQRGGCMEVKVDVTRQCGITNHEVTAALEQTIQYKHLKTTTDVTRSDITRMPEVSCKLMQSWKRVHLDPLVVEIPKDTPQSGIVGHPTLSINYRVRVDIKPTSNDLSTFTLGVPLFIGALQEVSSKGVSTEDRMRSASGSHQTHPSRHAASPPTQIPGSSGERFGSSTERPEGSFTPAGVDTSASVDTQTSFPYFGPQQCQQSTSDGEFYDSADSQSRLDVENLSSRTLSDVSSTPRSSLSVESSGPPAMGVRVPEGAAHAPSAHGQRSSCTYRKEVHHNATNWEDSLRRYHAPPDPRLVPQRPSSSSHGHHGVSSLTEVKQPAGQRMSSVPEQEVFELRDLEGRFSDLDPRRKTAKRRRSDQMC